MIKKHTRHTRWYEGKDAFSHLKQESANYNSVIHNLTIWQKQNKQKHKTKKVKSICFDIFQNRYDSRKLNTS